MFKCRNKTCDNAIYPNYLSYYRLIMDLGFPLCLKCKNCFDCGRIDCACNRCILCLELKKTCRCNLPKSSKPKCAIIIEDYSDENQVFTLITRNSIKIQINENCITEEIKEIYNYSSYFT